MLLNLSIAFLFFNILISLSLVKKIWQHHQTPGAKYLMGLSLAVAIWSFGFIFELISLDLSTKLGWVKFQYMGIAAIAPTWLSFAISYTRPSISKSNDKWKLLYLYLLPVFTLLVIWTNDWHGWFFKDTDIANLAGIPLLVSHHGVWFWIHIIYSYTVLLLGSYIFSINQVKSLKYYQDQAIIVLFAISLPLFSNFLHITKIIPGIDITIFAFNLSGILFFWVLYSRRFLNYLPVAYHEVMDSNENGVIILDENKRVISINRAARLLAVSQGMGKFDVGMELSELPDSLVDCLESLLSNEFRKRESTFAIDNEEKVFDVNATELRIDEKLFGGWIFTFHDISNRKKIENHLLKMQLDLEERVVNRTMDIQRLAEQRKRLIEVSVKMVSTFTFEQVIRTVMHSLQEVLDFSVCIIYWLDHEKGVLRSTEIMTTDESILDLVPDEIPMGTGIAGNVALTGAAILANNAIQDGRSYYISDILKPIHEHLVSLPLLYRGEVLGVFQVSRLYDSCFTQDEFELIQLFASLANVAIQNSKLYSELEQFSQDINRQKEQMRQLAKHIEQVREMEQLQLAQELHDRIGQDLTALVFNINIIDQVLPAGAPALVYERLADSKEVVKDSVQQVRNLLTVLRPPMLDEHGVISAIRWYADNFSRRSQLHVEITGEEIRPRLDIAVETALFRIAQEALNNTAKHAQAKHVKIQLVRSDNGIYMEIEDDGLGFDFEKVLQSTEREHWGLITMQERAYAIGGEMDIEAKKGKGTKVKISVPIRS